MVLCYSIENDGRPKSRPRYVIINDEIYIEYPEVGNAEDKRLVAKHLLSVPEKNNMNIDVSTDDDCHEIERDKLGGQKDAEVPSNDSHLEEIPQASVNKLGKSYVQKDINKSGTKEDISNGQHKGKISKKKKNSAEMHAATRRLLYARDEDVKLKISDHFPIHKFVPKNSSPATNTYGDDKDDCMESNTSGKSRNGECPYCNHKSEKKIKRHLLRHMKLCYCQACNDVMTAQTGYSLSHHRSEHTANLKCTKCSYPIGNVMILRSHVMSTHKDALLRQCCICGCWLRKAITEDSQLEVLADHVKKKHSGEKPHCLPWSFFTDLNDRMEYKDLCHCPDCPSMMMTSLTDLLHHLSQHTSEILEKCNFCKFSHHSKIWMKLHAKTHSRFLYKCPYCKYKTSKHFTLKYHIRNSHRKRLLGNKSKILFALN